MTTRFYYDGVRKDDCSDAYLRGQIQGVVEKFLKGGTYILHLWVKTLRNSKNSKKNIYFCELRLDLINKEMPILIKTSGPSFYPTVKELGKSLKTAMEKYTHINQSRLASDKLTA